MSIKTWVERQFTEVFKDVSSKAHKVDQSCFQLSGAYPIIDQGKEFIAGYVDDSSLVWHHELPVIIFGDHTRTIKYINFPFVLGADGTKVLKPDDAIDPKFAYYALFSVNISSAGYSRHFKFLKESSMRLTPVPKEQKRIAAILGKTDRLRRLRGYARELSDTYLQSVFIEMFGDPITNSKGWPQDRLSNLCEPANGIKAGPFGSSLKKESYSDKGIRIYGQEQVIGGDFTIGNYYITYEMFNNFKAYQVKPGDVLISLVGSFGKVAVVPEDIEPGIINPRLLKLSPKRERIKSIFLAHCFEHPATQMNLLHISHGGTMGILNAGLLREFRMIVPPIYMQEQFVRIAHKFECLQSQQREAERQAEHLFQTLLHRAFCGESL